MQKRPTIESILSCFISAGLLMVLPFIDITQVVGSTNPKPIIGMINNTAAIAGLLILIIGVHQLFIRIQMAIDVYTTQTTPTQTETIQHQEKIKSKPVQVQLLNTSLDTPKRVY